MEAYLLGCRGREGCGRSGQLGRALAVGEFAADNFATWGNAVPAVLMDRRVDAAAGLQVKARLAGKPVVFLTLPALVVGGAGEHKASRFLGNDEGAEGRQVGGQIDILELERRATVWAPVI